MRILIEELNKKGIITNEFNSGSGSGSTSISGKVKKKEKEENNLQHGLQKCGDNRKRIIFKEKILEIYYHLIFLKDNNKMQFYLYVYISLFFLFLLYLLIKLNSLYNFFNQKFEIQEKKIDVLIKLLEEQRNLNRNFTN
jgi:hypothetical protein